jgi:hypothetical protein
VNFLKELFNNTEILISNIIFFDFKKLILFLICFLISYMIFRIRLNRQTKNLINKTNIELKKINIEASHSVKKKNLILIHTYLFLLVSFFVITKENLNIVLPVITGIVIILIFSLKEQLNNIFLGILFKSNITTTIYEGMQFYLKENPNEIYTISKVNVFKSILKNEKTGQIESIENKELNSKLIIHKAIENLDYVEFKYIVPVNFNFDKYLIDVKKYFEVFLKEKNNYAELKHKIFNIKDKYNTLPYLKPFYDIDLKYKTKDEIEVTLKITTYDYNYDNYISDYLKLKPKLR